MQIPHQTLTAQFLAKVEVKAQLQLGWCHPYTCDYWRGLREFESFISDSCFQDYGVNKDSVYLNLRGDISYSLSWFDMKPPSSNGRIYGLLPGSPINYKRFLQIVPWGFQ